MPHWIARCAVVTALLAGPAPAQDVAARVALADAVRDMGCTADLGELSAREDLKRRSGLDGRATGVTIDSLVGDGLATFDIRRLILALSPGLCGGTRMARDIVLDAARLHGCTLTPADAAAHWSKVGIEPLLADDLYASLAPDGTVAPDTCGLKPTHPDIRAAWLAAFRENDCRIDLTDFSGVALRHGLPREDDPVMRGWMDDGAVRRVGQALYLDPGLCETASAPALSPDARDLAGAIAAQGCRQDGRRLAAAAEGRGIPRDRAEAALGALLLAGQATLEGDAVVLSPGACEASLPASLVDGTVSRLDAVVREAVEGHFRARGCTVPATAEGEEALLRHVLAALGLPRIRTEAGDALVAGRIGAVVTSSAFRREGGQMLWTECAP
jgi:hypothetical protein